MTDQHRADMLAHRWFPIRHACSLSWHVRRLVPGPGGRFTEAMGVYLTENGCRSKRIG